MGLLLEPLDLDPPLEPELPPVALLPPWLPLWPVRGFD